MVGGATFATKASPKQSKATPCAQFHSRGRGQPSPQQERKEREEKSDEESCLSGSDACRGGPSALTSSAAHSRQRHDLQLQPNRAEHRESYLWFSCRPYHPGYRFGDLQHRDSFDCRERFIHGLQG